MNEEIKEILEDVKRHLDYVEATKQASIRDNEMKAMYYYITNLQEENQKLKNKLKGNLMYMKSLKAIAEEKRRTPEDYFVDIQNENERLKQENQIKNGFGKDVVRLNKLTELKGGSD